MCPILNFTQLTTNDGSSNVRVTSNYVLMSSGCTQGSFVDLPVRRNARTVKFDLTRPSSGHVGITEVEIYVNGENVYDR